MNRGEIRWYTYRPPDKRRPVLVLSRQALLEVLHTATVAAITSTLHDSPTEVRRIIETVRKEGMLAPSEHLPRSTVHRLFKQHGLMSRTGEDAPGEDRRRFAYARAGQLWMSDVMYGPAVPDDTRRKRKTYLIAFLDDATRVIPHAEFAFAENTRAFLPVFKQALIRRGLPQRLFVDNGANYRSHQFALICAKLGVALIHARPFQPEGKGKIERFFRQGQTYLFRFRFDGSVDGRPLLSMRDGCAGFFTQEELDAERCGQNQRHIRGSSVPGESERGGGGE